MWTDSSSWTTFLLILGIISLFNFSHFSGDLIISHWVLFCIMSHAYFFLDKTSIQTFHLRKPGCLSYCYGVVRVFIYPRHKTFIIYALKVFFPQPWTCFFIFLTSAYSAVIFVRSSVFTRLWPLQRSFISALGFSSLAKPNSYNILHVSISFFCL